jgi:hypothetical protein
LTPLEVLATGDATGAVAGTIGADGLPSFKAVQVVLSYSTHVPAPMLAKEHVKSGSTVPNTFVDTKLSVVPSTTTTPSPVNLLSIKQALVILILAPPTLEIANPLTWEVVNDFCRKQIVSTVQKQWRLCKVQ